MLEARRHHGEAMTMSVPSDFSVNGGEPDSAWEEARQRVEEKRDFRARVVAYLFVNGFLAMIWLLSGAGDFWPGWVMAIWGAVLLLDAYNTWIPRPITDADIGRELRRSAGSRR
jgi:hypothetical protein